MPGSKPRTCKVCRAVVGKWKSYCDPCRMQVEAECSRRCRLEHVEARRSHDNQRYPHRRDLRDRKRGRLTDAELEARFAARPIPDPELPPDHLWLLWNDMRRIENQLFGPRRTVPLEYLMPEYVRNL